MSNILFKNTLPQRAKHSQFIVSKWNVRKTGGANVDELAALILSTGRVLQNVIAFRQKKKGKETGVLEIVAGGRRWRAVDLLIFSGKLSADFEMDWLEITEDQAIEMSLVENAGREPMHPADEFEAMQTLVQKGKTIEDVAAAFGIEPIVVKRRLKLAKIAPTIFQLYKEGTANLEQLEALSITDDHAKQEMVWASCAPYNRSGSTLKRLLTTENVSMDDSVARFVGVTAYESAGGIVIRDLFSDEDDGYFENVSLLESLAQENLEQYKSDLLKAGFSWVDIKIRVDHEERRTYGRARTSEREPTEPEKIILAQLEADQDAFDVKYANSGDEELTQEQEDELDSQEKSLINRWEEYNGKITIIHVDDVASIGALVTIDYQGNCEIIKNLIRPEDSKRINKTDTNQSGSDAGTSDKSNHSEKLTRQLTAHRTIALQAELMNRPDVALATLTARLAKRIFYDNDYSENAVKISFEYFSLNSNAPDIEETKAWQAIEEKRAQLKILLPRDCENDQLLLWLLKQDQRVVLDLLAFCLSTSINTVQPRETISSFEVLAKAVNLNMCNWWAPTQDSYFNHIPRLRIVEVIADALSPTAAIPLGTMKKGQAAEAAERLIIGTNWLPSLLTTKE
jgi:ParB family chromosome partitioning protein